MSPTAQHRSPRIKRPTRQHGAALIVGLLLMLVLTVLGVSGMNMATLELAMANNTYAKELAFRAAESGIEWVLTGPLDPTAPIRYVDRRPGGGPYSFDATVVCIGTSHTENEVAGDQNDLWVAHFEATVRGKGPRNARAVHTQGFYVQLPGAEAPEPDAPAVGNGCAKIPCDEGCLAADDERRLVRTYWRTEPID